MLDLSTPVVSLFPGILGLPSAKVEMTPFETGGSFLVTVPQGGGALGRVKRALLFPFTARAAAQAGLALDPSFTIRRFRDATNARSDNPTFLAGRDRAIEGMRWAGVHEG